MKKLSAMLMLLGLTSCVYSDGERSGQIVKLSHKGIIFKTYEGELATLAKGRLATMMSNSFRFSVKDEKVAAQIKEAMESGKTVSVHYEQSFIVIPWEGETNYFITEVSINNQ